MFDEQLRRVFDAALAELTEGARLDAERARQEGRETGLAEGRATGLAEGRKTGLAEGRAAGLAEGRATGLAEGLEQGRTQGWEDGREQGRYEGQQEAAEAHTAELVKLRAEAAEPAEDAGAGTERLLDAIRAIDRTRTLSEILDTLAACAGREASRAGVMLVRGSQLRGWRFIGFDQSFADASSVTVSAPDVSAIVDTLSTRGAAPTDGAGATALPILLAGETVAVLYADGFANQPGAPGTGHRLEILARHAGMALESLTAVKAARALLQAGGAANGDADEADASARRYAKLLVSEIKLYHEPAVVAGRRDRDLATRLGGEIARARALYEQRVSPAVRERADYFRDELVRTLANGDASLLHLS